MKIWKTDIKGDDKIIAFFKQTIYKANPKPAELENYIADLKNNIIPSAKAMEIPLHYLKEISMEEGANCLDVKFGNNSNEEFVVGDVGMKEEIFNYLKANLPVEVSTEKHSKLRAGKKPLIAMVVVAIIFLWILYLAIEIENGTEYELVGSGASVTGIALSIAYLGVTKVILIFAPLMAIALAAFIKKARNPKTIHRLVIER